MLPTENQCNGISGLDCCYTPPVTVSKMSTDQNGNSSSKSCISHKLAVMKPQASLELLPPMPSGLEPMKHQLAGHKFGHIDNSDLYGILDCKDGTILKPVIENKGQREKYFYELINGVYSPNSYFRKELYELDSIRQLAEFTPKFLGLISLPEHPDVSYVKMDDISHGLTKPYILDVKIGAQCWSHDAPVNKQQRQKLRCPHLDDIRFQILGAKYYDCDTGKPVVNMSLRKCTPHDLLHTGLYNIFRGLPKNTRTPILERILTNLRSISDWFRSQTYLSFRGSSLLIVFEGDCDASDSSFQAPFVQVKMIDFVHVWESSQIDSNYLDGITSLMSYIISLIAIFKA